VYLLFVFFVALKGRPRAAPDARVTGVGPDLCLLLGVLTLSSLALSRPVTNGLVWLSQPSEQPSATPNLQTPYCLHIPSGQGHKMARFPDLN
jgi:hypothetical protein